jgi:hypothetical protein
VKEEWRIARFYVVLIILAVGFAFALAAFNGYLPGSSRSDSCSDIQQTTKDAP